MQRIARLILFILLFVGAFSTSAYAVPHPEKIPVNVTVGFFVNDITSVDEQTESITFQGTITSKWKDDRLAFDGTKPEVFSNEAAEKKLESIWFPQIVFMDARGPQLVEARWLKIMPDGQVTFIKRFQSTIETPMDLRQFPFDHQTAEFNLQSFVYPVSHVVLKLNAAQSGFGPKAIVNAWSAHKVRSYIHTVNYPLYNHPFSRMTMKITYHRKSTYYVFQILVPLVLIVFLSFSSFWMLHNPSVNRVAISLTAVLTIVVFEWRIFSKLPHLTYHTFTDVLMLYSFMIAAATIIPNLVHEHISVESRKKVLTWFRVGFPLAYAVGIIVIILVFFS